ncbi:MAG: UPF0182 family protein [Chthonomonadaceae bacterium]|nr:UPF0182 family protein [Chthonomonadaceae bacterium]
MPQYPDRPTLILDEDTTERRPPRYGLIVAFLALLFLSFVFFHNAVPLYVDWLWFREMKSTVVYSVTIRAKFTLFVLFGGAFFTVWHLSLRHALRTALSSEDGTLSERLTPDLERTIRKSIGRVALAVSLFFSLWAGRVASNEWANWLEFTHATPFGKTDPVFGRDLSFYLFTLPFLEFATKFLTVTLLMGLVAVAGIHLMRKSAATLTGLFESEHSIRALTLGLLASLAIVRAFSAYLGVFELLRRENGVFYGAGYVDLRFRLPVTWLEVTLLIVTALLLLVAIVKPKTMKAAAIGAGTWLVTSWLIGGVLPSAMQKLIVEPNQFSLEKENIERNIALTRLGFGLDKVRRVENFPADESLTVSSLRTNADTLENARLWDYGFLAKIYAQTQTVKTYYQFEQNTVFGSVMQNLDIDRYKIDGKQRQVILAAREMNSDSLPASTQTWQNRRLGYTHGYGVVASPVNKVTEGLPEYFVQGFPPKAAANSPLTITRPELYYGQLTREHVFVNAQSQEFDYPSTGSAAVSGAGGNSGVAQDQYSKYAGAGGIEIGGSLFRRLVFAMQLGDWNTLWTGSFTPQTRVMIRRDIRERVMTLAPFLQLDNDPYLVISEGRQFWMLDAYTISDRLPYSTQKQIGVGPQSFISPNYLRNSVKATVDTYDGTTTFYLADPSDPIAQTYAKIYPGLLKPLSEMPASLREHLRYPEDMFRLQRSVYGLYHVDDARVFYANEDAWAVPTEPNQDTAQPEAAKTKAEAMEPYYVTLKLHNEKAAEYVLMSPLAPFNKEDQNVLGWMCARCDPAHYGELVLYRFPQQSAIAGPTQIIARINGDPAISPQLSLLRQGGSTATFGNLLMLPVEKSLLTIAPLYIESTNSAKLPQLQKVVVSYGSRVVMENTLDEALNRLFPGYTGKGAPADSTSQTSDAGQQTPEVKSATAPSVTLKSLIQNAARQYESAKSSLKAGDFAAYGEKMKTLERTLNALKQKSDAGGK